MEDHREWSSENDINFEVKYPFDAFNERTEPFSCRKSHLRTILRMKSAPWIDGRLLEGQGTVNQLEGDHRHYFRQENCINLTTRREGRRSAQSFYERCFCSEFQGGNSGNQCHLYMHRHVRGWGDEFSIGSAVLGGKFKWSVLWLNFISPNISFKNYVWG
jgi:hypothetical protein